MRIGTKRRSVRGVVYKRAVGTEGGAIATLFPLMASWVLARGVLRQAARVGRPCGGGVGAGGWHLRALPVDGGTVIDGAFFVSTSGGAR